MPTDANANHRFKALIFDFDGTLIDSAPDLHAAAVRMLVPLGRREPSVTEVAMMIGDGVPKLVERCFAATGDIPPEEEFAAHVSAFIKDYEPRSAELTTVFPNAKDALQGLKDNGIKIPLPQREVRMLSE